MPSGSPLDRCRQLVRVLQRAVDTALAAPSVRAGASIALATPLAAGYWVLLSEAGVAGIPAATMLVATPLVAGALTLALGAVQPASPLGRAVLGIVALGTVVTGGTLAGFLLVAPLLAEHPTVTYDIAGHAIDSLLGRLLLSGLGLAVALATVRLLNVAAARVRRETEDGADRSASDEHQSPSD